MPKKKIPGVRPGVLFDKEPQGKGSKEAQRYKELMKKRERARKDHKAPILTGAEERELQRLRTQQFGKRTGEKKEKEKKTSKKGAKASSGFGKAMLKKYLKEK
jgi:hypothetical protein